MEIDGVVTTLTDALFLLLGSPRGQYGVDWHPMFPPVLQHRGSGVVQTVQLGRQVRGALEVGYKFFPGRGTCKLGDEIMD